MDLNISTFLCLLVLVSASTTGRERSSDDRKAQHRCKHDQTRIGGCSAVFLQEKKTMAVCVAPSITADRRYVPTSAANQLKHSAQKIIKYSVFVFLLLWDLLGVK